MDLKKMTNIRFTITKKVIKMKLMPQIKLLALSLLLLSCFDSDPLKNYKTDDSRMYISNYDKKINYKSYETFHVVDSVFILNENQVRVSTRASNATFINIFKQNLEIKKYKYVGKNENPDLGIIISRVNKSKIGFKSPSNSYFNTFWNFPQFDEEGFEYPGYYTNYEIGDTIWNIEVVDLKNVKTNRKLNVVWNVQIRGEGVFDEDNFAYILDKTFEISTFLGNENK